MSRHARLVARVARKLASQAFSAKYELELSLFGDRAEARREIWIERSWPSHVDRARDILADILPDVLLLTYRDTSNAVREIEAAETSEELIAAVRENGAAVAAATTCQALTDLFVGPLIGAPRPFGPAAAAPVSNPPSPPAEATC